MTVDMELSVSSDEKENFIISPEKRIELSLVIDHDANLLVASEDENILSVVSNQEDIDIDFDFSGFYTGAYEVTPAVVGTELITANKTMLRDIIINPIPTSDVDNLSGGRTFTIG